MIFVQNDQFTMGKPVASLSGNSLNQGLFIAMLAKPICNPSSFSAIVHQPNLEAMNSCDKLTKPDWKPENVPCE